MVIPTHSFHTHPIYTKESGRAEVCEAPIIESVAVLEEDEKTSKERDDAIDDVEVWDGVLTEEAGIAEINPTLQRESIEEKEHVEITMESPSEQSSHSISPGNDATPSKDSERHEFVAEQVEEVQKTPIEVSRLTEATSVSLSSASSFSPSFSSSPERRSLSRSSTGVSSKTFSTRSTTLPHSSSELTSSRGNSFNRTRVYPRMTAEQLKIALIRLRSRIKTIQL
ncbi:unnamed protein product [Phytomonas sp. Hart1]|nr:unnamed protein product [Phytomonas sp. Hart1]|eukprot:CCW69028.1 unnamed protein product [Phytomonas sp. isolate Hart1]